jgi:mono/diheme cytochrome c family protein
MKTRTAIALATLLSIQGCGQEERAETPAPAAPAQPAQPAQPAPPAQPGAAQPGAQPAQPGEAAQPAAEPAAEPAAATASAQEGQQLYVTYCASCHGPRGEGDGPAGMALEPKPAKHSNGEYMNALSNEHIFKVIKEGGPAVGKSPLMAPWGGTLNDEQIWDLVAFTRSLAQPPYEGSVP